MKLPRRKRSFATAPSLNGVSRADRRGTDADQLPANVLPMRARTFRQSLLGLLGRIARSASRRLGTRHTGRFCGQTVLCDAYAGPPLQPRPIWMDLLRLQHFLAMHSGRAGQAAIRSAPLPPKAHACVEVWCPGCDVYSTRRSPFDPGRELGQTITLGRIAFDTTVTAPVPHFGEQSPSKPR